MPGDVLLFESLNKCRNVVVGGMVEGRGGGEGSLQRLLSKVFYRVRFREYCYFGFVLRVGSGLSTWCLYALASLEAGHVRR